MYYIDLRKNMLKWNDKIPHEASHHEINKIKSIKKNTHIFVVWLNVKIPYEVNQYGTNKIKSTKNKNIFIIWLKWQYTHKIIKLSSCNSEYQNIILYIQVIYLDKSITK